MLRFLSLRKINVGVFLAYQSLFEESKRVDRLVHLGIDKIFSRKQHGTRWPRKEKSEMLVLTRKPSEMIRIGEDIFIKVIRTGPGSVKIGIEAPRSVRVLRAELCDDSRIARRGDLIDLGDLDFDVATRHESDPFPRPLSA